jgi:hypothetical protein
MEGLICFFIFHPWWSFWSEDAPFYLEAWPNVKVLMTKVGNFSLLVNQTEGRFAQKSLKRSVAVTRGSETNDEARMSNDEGMTKFK